MKDTVFIHTNDKQMIGALVSQYSMRRNSANADKFDVKLISHRDHPFFQRFEGKPYLRDGTTRLWHNDDLQSFTPLRFMPPELMGYEGRAVVVDPDVFAVGDVWELLSRDMGGKAIVCRARSGSKKERGHFATSVMLLDCAKLKHWHVETAFAEMFENKRDYMQWISLLLEPIETIGSFENEWNDFDRLTPKTRMVHNTKRRTQPWKTGLPVDFLPPEKWSRIPPIGWLVRMRRQVFGDYAFLGHYDPHPDPNQERFFFGLLRECVEKGIVTEEMLREAMSKNYVRHDAFEVMERAEPLAA